MTHEELLEKINEYSSSLGDKTRRPFFNALRAVVELHKPVKSDYEYIYCEECTDDSYVYIKYPCPTIQAIEKELG